MDRPSLEAFFVALGEKPFRATQLLQWIHQRGVSNLDEMTNISKSLRTRLAETTEIRCPEVVLEQASDDGTRKWLLRVDSGNCIEAVFIPEQDRGTLCVSSQVGCALDCSFCSTAQQGFNRNLSVAEIIGQVWVANRALGRDARVPPEAGCRKRPLGKTPLEPMGGGRIITNVVMMGMGEPLLNFDNVVQAMSLMTEDFAYGLSKRRVTLSTAGVVPALDRLREVSDVSLAVSLHAPNDALRNELVPINKKYPIKELLASCLRYLEGKPHRRITFEYVMLDGVNDSPQQARELVHLLADIPSKINLIPFNPFPNTRYARSSDVAIDRFRDILVKSGFTTITRRTRGDDIDAACGQLAGKVLDRSKRKLRQIPVTVVAQ